MDPSSPASPARGRVKTRLNHLGAHLAAAKTGDVPPRLPAVGWSRQEAERFEEIPDELSDHDKFIFDLNGWLRIPGALSADHLAALRASLRRNWHRRTLGVNSRKRRGYDQLHDMLRWARPDSDPFRSLLCHPPLVPALNTLLDRGWKTDGEPFVLSAKTGQFE